MCEQPLSDAGLVSHQDDQQPGFFESLDGVGGAAQQLHAVRVTKIAALLDDRAIAIDERGASHGRFSIHLPSKLSP